MKIKYSFRHSFIQYEDAVGDEDDDELLRTVVSSLFLLRLRVSPFSLSTDNHIVVLLISKLRRCYWRCWAMIGLRPTWGSLGVDSLTFIITKVSTHSQDPDGCTIITEDAQGTNKWILSAPGMKKLFLSRGRCLTGDALEHWLGVNVVRLSVAVRCDGRKWMSLIQGPEPRRCPESRKSDSPTWKLE
jgi:hypothetical protein